MMSNVADPDRETISLGFIGACEEAILQPDGTNPGGSSLGLYGIPPSSLAV